MKSRTSTYYRHGLVLILVVLLFGLTAASVAAALGASDFEGDDGNLESTEGGTDWDSWSPPELAIADDFPSGSEDNSFQQSKEDDEGPSIGFGSIPNNKSDLKRFYVAHEQISDTDFLYLAWERANTLGSANIDFEFNQSEELSANGVTPMRSAGDMLITYTFGGNSEAVVIGLSRWVTDPSGSCEAAASAPCWGPVASMDPGEAQAAINQVPVYEPFLGPDIPENYLLERTFGEVALNLTAIGVFSDPSVCVNFGSVHVTTRSSGSFNASLKDFIAPISVNVTNCGTLTVNIQTAPSIAGASYAISADGAEPAVESEVTGDGAYYSLKPGSYTIAVTEPATVWDGLVLVEHGYDLTGLYCDVRGDGTSATPDLESGTVAVIVGEGGIVDCYYTFVQRGSIVLTKTTEPPSNTNRFTFTGDLSGGISDGGQIALADIVPGQYSSTETALAGWDLTGISCGDDANSSGNIGLATATFNVDPGETVTCNFVNTKRGEIIIEKQTLPDGDSQSFSFAGDVGGSLSDGQQTSIDVAPGSYSSTETVPAGWDLTGITCDDGASSGDIGTATASFNVDPGEVVKCTFTNTKRGQITVEKQTLPNSDPQGFNFTGDVAAGLTDGQSSSVEVIPGTYTSTESSLEGWDLTSLICDDANSSGNAGTGVATFNVEPGEGVKCIFTNTKRGQIIVQKTLVSVDPNAGSYLFSFTSSYAGPFSIRDGEPNNSGYLMPGTYSVAESLIDGFDLTGVSCDDNSDPSSISLSPGEIVTCTFENTQRGTIIVEKAISGPSPDHYVQHFDITLKGPSGFNETIQLAQIGITSFPYENIPAGSYAITESKTDGWGMVSITCTDGRNSVTPVELAAGATVTCTVTNQMQLYFGSQGFWRNWNNHHTADELQTLIDWVKLNNPQVFAPDLDIPTIDAIFNNGGASDEQRLLIKLTAVKLDLAASDPDPLYFGLQHHAYLYNNCLLDLSTMLDAYTYFGDGATVGDVVAAVEAGWSGNLGSSPWSFDGLTAAQVSMLTKVLNGIYLGTLVEVDPSTYPDSPGCKLVLAISAVGSAGEGEFGTETVSSLDDSTVSMPYSLNLEATGGTRPYYWSVIGGRLPAGLSLDAGTGEISGVATAAESQTFTVQVIDSDGSTDAAQMAITINPAPEITTTGLTPGSAGVPYSDTLMVTGGTSPFNWQIVSGVLPAGLALDSSSGEISGTPAANDAQEITIQVTDQAGATDSQELLLVIGTAVVTSSLPEGTVGAAYGQSLAVLGGTPPYSWSLSSGRLPGGIILSPAGTLSGTPGTAGTYYFTVAVMDLLGVSDTQDLSITINPPPSITTATLPLGTVGGGYNAMLAATQGTAPYVWSLFSGTLPADLSMDANGVISGTPTAAGTQYFTVEVMDQAGATDTRALSITVYLPLVITTSSLPQGTVGAAYSESINASGGAPNQTWTITSGALPDGLSLDASTGAISGTPNTAEIGAFTVEVMDEAGSTDSAALSITINPPVVISTTSLPDSTVGAAYSEFLAASDGTLPYSWSLFSGTLPSGLSLTLAGEILGTPGTDGAYPITLQVEDAAGATDTQALTITINPPVVISTTSMPQGTVGALYGEGLAATQGTPPYSWSLASGALPTGLSLSGSTGQVSGTPSVFGEKFFTVQVTDAAGATDTQDLSIDINPILQITTTSLPQGTKEAAYAQNLESTGGTSIHTWSVIGALPSGLTLAAGSGLLSGTVLARDSRLHRRGHGRGWRNRHPGTKHHHQPAGGLHHHRASLPGDRRLL